MPTLLALLLGAGALIALVWLRSRYFDFRGQKPEHYSDTEPRFDIREVFNGPIACEGVIYGPLGRVVSRFTAEMHGSWDGATGTLTERFHYDSGATQERAWTLTLGEGGRIRAEAEDIDGVGEGAQSGSAVRLRYRIRLPASAGGHVLDTTDWMYLVADGRIINRSQFRKFGIKVAELVATMRKTTQ